MPSLLQLDLNFFRFGLSTTSTSMNCESTNERLHEEANCMACQWNIKYQVWQAVGNEGRGNAKTQRTGKRVVTGDGTSSEL